MKSYAIVGYAYRADTWCEECVLDDLIENLSTDHYRELEKSDSLFATVGEITRIRGIDWEDERKYDSDDFPKVIFADQCEGDHCNKCHRPLIWD